MLHCDYMKVVRRKCAILKISGWNLETPKILLVFGNWPPYGPWSGFICVQLATLPRFQKK